MKKGKCMAVMASSSSGYEQDDNFQECGDDYDELMVMRPGRSSNFRPVIRVPSRAGSSKYDFVKVKVWLGDNADHYYVLSRFLLSRMLTVTKIPNHVAIKVALDLKKLLIDNSLLDVSQSDLEVNLFKLMERRGYGAEYINRYKMMTRFHHQRVPLVILVCGTASVGKSTIATQLAQRLNLPNVLQTYMVYELLRTSTDAPLASSPIWERNFSSSEELITEFCRECRIVRKGLAGDLRKAMKDGKPVIIEGMHLDPSIYLLDDEKKPPAHMPTKDEYSKPFNEVNKNEIQNINNSSISHGSQGEINDCYPGNVRSVEEISADRLNNVAGFLESINIGGDISKRKGETVKDPAVVRNPSVKLEISGAQPIIVPIVLKMADFDHKALLEEWICTHTSKEKHQIQDKDKLIGNLKTIQDYLCSFKSRGLTVVNISATTFPQTLDWLHNYLLQCIEQGISSSTGCSGEASGN
ncbi:hypothetical protein ACH5RR_016985 [Cinchona calisaya]|uniref:2-phosphoglycerate kinase n=1 Tax=Cinchona calisaya TaxID=153742 RepID=A0ABD2ZXI0_9GENT